MKKCSLYSKIIHSCKLLFGVAPLYLSFCSRILAFTVNLNRKLDRFSLHCTETRVATRCATRNRSQLGEEEGFIFHSRRPLTPDILAHVLDDNASPFRVMWLVGRANLEKKVWNEARFQNFSFLLATAFFRRKDNAANKYLFLTNCSVCSMKGPLSFRSVVPQTNSRFALNSPKGIRKPCYLVYLSLSCSMYHDDKRYSKMYTSCLTEEAGCRWTRGFKDCQRTNAPSGTGGYGGYV